MAGKDSLEMAKRILDHHGLNYAITRNKHYKIIVDHNGQSKTLVTGGTLSEYRAVMNFYHTIKRLLTELGVAFKGDSKKLIYN